MNIKKIISTPFGLKGLILVLPLCLMVFSGGSIYAQAEVTDLEAPSLIMSQLRNGTLFEIAPSKSTYNTNEEIVLTLKVHKNTSGIDVVANSVTSASFSVIDIDPSVPGGGVVWGNVFNQGEYSPSVTPGTNPNGVYTLGFSKIPAGTLLPGVYQILGYILSGENTIAHTDTYLVIS